MKEGCDNIYITNFRRIKNHYELYAKKFNRSNKIDKCFDRFKLS